MRALETLCNMLGHPFLPVWPVAPLHSTWFEHRVNQVLIEIHSSTVSFIEELGRGLLFCPSLKTEVKRCLGLADVNHLRLEYSCIERPKPNI